MFNPYKGGKWYENILFVIALPFIIIHELITSRKK
jgi:hypothetical protein